MSKIKLFILIFLLFFTLLGVYIFKQNNFLEKNQIVLSIDLPNSTATPNIPQFIKINSDYQDCNISEMLSPFEDPQPYLSKTCIFQSKPNLLDQNIDLDALTKTILEQNNPEDNIIKLEAAPKVLSNKLNHFRWIKRTENGYSSLYWPCAAHSTEHISPRDVFWFTVCGIRWYQPFGLHFDEQTKIQEPMAFAILARTTADHPQIKLQLVMEHSWPGTEGWAHAQFLVYNGRLAYKVRSRKILSDENQVVNPSELNQATQAMQAAQATEDWVTSLYAFDDHRFRRIATYQEYRDARQSNLCKQYAMYVCERNQLVKSQILLPYEFKMNSQDMSGQVVETITHLNGEVEQLAHDIFFNPQKWKYQARGNFRLYN